jgi:lysophospholipase L1-like esterase
MLLVGVPWLVGTVLAVRVEDARLAASIEALSRDRSVPIVVLVAGAMLLVTAHVFSAAAAFFCLTWAGLAGLLLTALGRSSRLPHLLRGVTTATVSIFAAGWLLNAVLDLPAVAERWGSPRVVESWRHRYDDLWRHNVFGLRSPYEQTEKPDGTTRVVVLGDSYSWGDKIASSDSIWPARLERSLRERFPARGFEVVNTGQKGFTTANEAEMLQRVGWQFQPDLVIVQWLVNDARRSTPDFGHPYPSDLWPDLHLLPTRFRRGSIGGSALYGFVRARVKSLVHPAPMDTRFEPLYQPAYPGFQQMKEALTSMANAAREHGVPIVLVVWPLNVPGEWTAETHPHRPYHEQVEELARADGYHVLDLTTEFAKAGGDWSRWWATPWDSHPGEAAHRLAAEAVERFLSRSDWATATWGEAPRVPARQ